MDHISDSQCMAVGRGALTDSHHHRHTCACAPLAIYVWRTLSAQCHIALSPSLPLSLSLSLSLWMQMISCYVCMPEHVCTCRTVLSVGIRLGCAAFKQEANGWLTYYRNVPTQQSGEWVSQGSATLWYSTSTVLVSVMHDEQGIP